MPSSPDTPHSPRTHRPRSGSHAHTSSSHSMPFPSEWPSPAPEPQPAPREPSTDHHERRERRDSRGPAHHAVNLADRLAAMRMRVDMKALYNDLDATTKEMQYLAAGLHTTSFGHSEKEQRHWGKLFNDAIKTLNTVDDMYDDLDQWLEHVETGKPGRSPAAQLPIQLAYISAVTTVMKYSAIACVTIQGQILCSPYDPPQQYYDDLEARLKIFATACEPPQQS
ncbi:hypothetical protein F5Y11DRAFT_342512 [Daldinia sp. FL1419]|nr:hypothetical protein F5Y11DRAFT_342512 [Daldinia sp. FL1419]